MIEKYLHSWFLAAAILLTPFVAVADKTQDLKASIVITCIYQSGEFGNALVDICVKENLEAATALAGYPKKSARIVNRCTQRLQADGWIRVKMCADEDIEADTALGAYDDRHQSLIEECRTKFGTDGPAKVKACVDQKMDASKPKGN